MDYAQEIKELKETLKGFDTSRIGNTSDDKIKKTADINKKVCLLNSYEELKRIEDINQELQQNKIEEAEQSENHRNPLSIEREEVFKILLSWGGGEDGFKLWFKDNELIRGVYYMADWGEYQEQDLTTQEAEAVYSFYMGGEVDIYREKQN